MVAVVLQADVAGVPQPLQADVAGALTVADTAARTTLVSLLAAVDGLEALAGALGTETTAAAILAKLEAVRGLVDGLEANTAGLATQATLAAVLTELGDKLEPGQSVRSVDAAEATGGLYVRVDATAGGATEVVACPAGKRLRVISVRTTLPNPGADPPVFPLLTLAIGALEVQRGYVLGGRVPSDRIGAVDTHLTITLSVAAEVHGSLYYEVLNA